jgi:2,3-bisphosphoglycerate-independent phosphoglycerate mutase
MVDPETGVALTQHTTFPVPLVFKGRAGLKLDEGGNLADIAPTILHLLGIQQPAVMTGRSLLH